jgi:hypothetical protein
MFHNIWEPARDNMKFLDKIFRHFPPALSLLHLNLSGHRWISLFKFWLSKGLSSYISWLVHPILYLSVFFLSFLSYFCFPLLSCLVYHKIQDLTLTPTGSKVYWFPLGFDSIVSRTLQLINNIATLRLPILSHRSLMQSFDILHWRLAHRYLQYS